MRKTAAQIAFLVNAKTPPLDDARKQVADILDPKTFPLSQIGAWEAWTRVFHDDPEAMMQHAFLAHHETADKALRKIIRADHHLTAYGQTLEALARPPWFPPKSQEYLYRNRLENCQTLLGLKEARENPAYKKVVSKIVARVSMHPHMLELFTQPLKNDPAAVQRTLCRIFASVTASDDSMFTPSGEKVRLVRLMSDYGASVENALGRATRDFNRRMRAGIFTAEPYDHLLHKGIVAARRASEKKRGVLKMEVLASQATRKPIALLRKSVSP
jgi:hypothetical protein